MRFAVLWRLAVLLALIGLGVWWWLGSKSEPETPVVQFVDRPLETNFATSVTIGSQEFICREGKCTPNQADSAREYFYEQSRDEKRGIDKIYLKSRQAEAGEAVTIMESTPLTSPRGLFLSPDRKQLAFWLDNVVNTSEKLTELWIYDTDAGGIRLLAEKLYRPDIRSEPRWSSDGSKLFFVADTGEQSTKEDRLELIMVGLEPSVTSRFFSTGWIEFINADQTMLADVSPSGEQVAFLTENIFGGAVLHLHNGLQETRTSLRGTVPYLAWVGDELIYAVQNGQGVTWWQTGGQAHRLMSRRYGIFRSAHLVGDAQYLLMALTTAGNKTDLLSLHLESGTIIAEGSFLSSGQNVFIRSVALNDDLANPEVAGGAVQELDDAEIAAFVNKHQQRIIGSDATPVRLIMTNITNHIFFEYRNSAGQEQRVLLVVIDAIHGEWAIKAKYQSIRGTWQKAQGGGQADPNPLRLYEWEPEIALWVFKQDLAS